MCFRSALTRAVSLPTRPGCRNFEPEAGLEAAVPDSSRRQENNGYGPSLRRAASCMPLPGSSRMVGPCRRARRGRDANSEAATRRGAFRAEGAGGGQQGQRFQSAGRSRATSSAAGFHHPANRDASRPLARLYRHGGLDPAVRRQGRTAGRYRLHRLSAGRRRSGDATGNLSFQRRSRRGLRLSATRRRRTLAAADCGRRGGFLRLTRSDAERRDLARFHRSRLHRPGRHRLQPLRCVRRARCASSFSRSTATSIRSR